MKQVTGRISIPVFFLFFLVNFYAYSQPPAEIDYDRLDYLTHKKILDSFKSSLSKDMLAYYLPRKRYIDRQSIYPYAGTNYQVFIIKRGTFIRNRNLWNKKEIRELEKFLESANDFELNRYFGEKEDYYLGIRSEMAVREIRKDARRDEAWRQKTDPEFARYLKVKANFQEIDFYKKNLSLFYVDFFGKERISYLQKLSKRQQHLFSRKDASLQEN